jgi:hypothetical protein
MATLVFEIRWNPSVSARLVFVRDNGEDKLEEEITSHTGRITLRWEADKNIAHFIDWDLWSAGNKLEDLEAVAGWADDPEGEPEDVKTLAEADEADNHWADGGTL